MSEYQLELKQIVDYPRCRIYRQFIGLLMKDKNIRVGGTSRLYHFTVLSCFANFRTSYKRIDGISYTIYPGEWLCRVSELTEWFRTRFQHQALAILRELQDRHLITYTLLGRGKLVKFKIKGWCKYNRVLEYNAPCQKDTGFFFLPISVANELVSAGRCSEMDAMLDLWINTVYNDTQVQGSEVGPVVYMRNGTGSPLSGYAELAQRWGVSKATAGRYLRKMQELGYSRLLVKHENIQSACNTFMCSRLAELCDVYTPKAYLMSTSNETRRLFPMHPFIVGTEWVEDFSAVDYGSIKESPALRQQYLDSMALYAMFCRIADTPQFAYSPAKGVFAYDWDEAFDVTDFVIKLCLYNSDAGTEQLRRMLQHFSQHPFENDAELCLQSAAEHLNMDADELRSSYMQAMERFCKVTEAQVAELTDVLSVIYPTPLIVYYEEYIKLLQHKITIYANKYE